MDCVTAFKFLYPDQGENKRQDEASIAATKKKAVDIGGVKPTGVRHGHIMECLAYYRDIVDEVNPQYAANKKPRF